MCNFDVETELSSITLNFFVYHILPCKYVVHVKKLKCFYRKHGCHIRHPCEINEWMIVFAIH